jgi:hypothetical protein
MSEDQLEARIRASLTRRAGAVHVEPDLAGLADRAGPGRAQTQRYPLVAVAVVLATLAVTSVALGQGYRESHEMLRSGHRADRTGDPTTTTHPPGSTTAPKGPNARKSTSTTITVPVPTSGQPPGNATPTTVQGDAAANGPGVVPAPVAPPAGTSCDPVGGVLASTSWDGDDVLVAEIGRNDGIRHIGVWRDVGSPDRCPQRVQDPDGRPFLFHLATPTGEAQVEVHAFGCGPSGLEVVNGLSYDGLLWFITVETYVLDGIRATLVDARELELLEAEHPDTIDALRQTSCGVAPSGG